MYLEDLEDLYRATGRTIRIKLRTILQMSETPGVWIRVEDHWHTPQATRHLVQRIKEFCNDYGMKVEEQVNNQGYFLRFVK